MSTHTPTPIDIIRDEILNCKRCKLHKQCNAPVPSIGVSPCDIILCGEAPGQEEDLLGEPFVGRCGKLLDKMLADAGLNRENVYITNTVKCNPKDKKKNRPPEKEEIDACKQFLLREILEVDPKVIVTFGKIPTGLLLNLPKTFTLKSVVGNFCALPVPDNKIEKIISVVPLYHPSFLLQYGKNYIDNTVKSLKKIKEFIKEN